MRSKYFLSILFLLALFPRLQAQPHPAAASERAAVSASSVIQRMAANERGLLQRMRKFHPIVETYIQNMRFDPQLGDVPLADHYFLGQLDPRRALGRDHSYLKKSLGLAALLVSPITDLARFYSMHFHSAGFLAMLFPDPRHFDARYYAFRYIRQQYLGDVRCYVFNVRPRRSLGFIGRVWIEERHDNLVRFNGTFAPDGSAFHFDSWRVNLRPGLWLPAFVYSEESNLKGTTMFGLAGHARFIAQTRLWGYGLHHYQFATTPRLIDSTVRDLSRNGGGAASPVAAERQWQRQAEDNVLNRLRRAGMLAPPGPVDKVLDTVVNNLEITNHLAVSPRVRCRILLVTPFVAFNIGHTIVLSRGLIDVLPDEPTLALMLAHGLASIIETLPIDTRFAFYDRMLVPDDHVLQSFRFRYGLAQQDAVARETVRLMQHSPYAGQLSSVGLFLEAMQARAAALPHLVGSGLLGNPLAQGSSLAGFGALLQSAPPLEFASIKQIEALPLGSRLLFNPWTDAVSLLRAAPVSLQSAAEKMPFQITPQHPFLRRFTANKVRLAMRLHHPAGGHPAKQK